MIRIEDSDNFNKRIVFFTSISARNDYSKILYKPRLSLVFKKDYKSLQSNKNETEISYHNYLINNKSFFNKSININKYINTNSLSPDLHQRNFIKNNVRSKKTLIKENLNNYNNQDNTYKKEFSFKNQDFSNNIKNENKKEEIRNEFKIENKSNSFIFKKEKSIVEKQNVKHIEKSILKQLEEKIEERIITKSINKINISNIESNNSINQREEKVLINRLYQSVMKKWDKEKKRKGYLYG